MRPLTRELLLRSAIVCGALLLTILLLEFAVRALGEADAGIVYQSDALGDVADQLIAIPVAERHNQLASYPIAPLLDAAEPSLAERFMRFVLSDEALAILEANGFCWPARQDDVEVDEAATEPALEFPDIGEATKIECEAASLEDG